MIRPSGRNGMQVMYGDLGFVKTEIFLILGLTTTFSENQK